MGSLYIRHSLIYINRTKDAWSVTCLMKRHFKRVLLGVGIEKSCGVELPHILDDACEIAPLRWHTGTPKLIKHMPIPYGRLLGVSKNAHLHIYILVSHSLGAVSSIHTHWLLIIEPIQRVVNIGNVSHFRSYIPSGSSYLQNSAHLPCDHDSHPFFYLGRWPSRLPSVKCVMQHVCWAPHNK